MCKKLHLTESEMDNYFFLLSIAIIMLTTKILGAMTNKVNMPQVV